MRREQYDFKRLAAVREAKFRQEDFAQMLKVTVVTLSRMENGHNASYELIFKACKLLDLDSSEVIYSTKSSVFVT